MRTIHKHEVSIDRFTLFLPKEWKFLHLDIQGNTPFMWVEVETDKDKQGFNFVVVGTGWDIDEIKLNADEYSCHLGTYLQGPWVWHLYQIYENT